MDGFAYASGGWFFVTICTHKRQSLFGEIRDGIMILNEVGEMVKKWWNEVSCKFADVKLDEFIVMPNHVHGIIIIANAVVVNNVGADLCVGPKNVRVACGQCGHICPPLHDVSLCRVIQWFKTMTTNEYLRQIKQNNWLPFYQKLWQGSFYDHIIRNEKTYWEILEYIRNNLMNWATDEENGVN